MDSMTQLTGVGRIPISRGTSQQLTLVRAEADRLDLSQFLGLDVALLLGPTVGATGAFTEQARNDAFADMVASGFVDLDHAAAALTVLAGVIDEIEDEDNGRGFEPEMLAWGRVA